MKNLNYILSITLLFLSNILFAQDVEMADVMRENGKIYVVVGVLSIIFIGIIGFLISIDRKVGKLEDEMKNS